MSFFGYCSWFPSERFREEDSVMSIQPEHATQDDLLKAFREGLLSFEELMEAAGPDFGALVEVAPEIALRLVVELGGTEVWVPMSADKGSPLRRVLSESDAQVVVSIYDRCRLRVPTLRRLKLGLRDSKILSLRAKGWKTSDLARHFQLTERRIQVICARHREALE